MKKDNWLDEKAKTPEPDDLAREGLPPRLPGTTAATFGLQPPRITAPEYRLDEDASAPHIPPGESGHIRVNE